MSGQVRGGVQLLGPDGLPRAGQDLQGSGAVRFLGLLRRVQPDRTAGPLRGRAADRGGADLQEGAQEPVHLHGRRRGGHEPRVRPLPHDESGLRGAPGAAGEPEGELPDGGHDGAGQTDHHPRQAGVLRVPGERAPGAQVLRPVQAVRGAAVQAGALRLRSAEHPLRPAHPRRLQARQPAGLREHHRDARAPGHEPVQAGGRGRAALPLAHQRPLPGDRAGEGGLPGPGGGHLQPGARCQPHQPPLLDAEGNPALRDAARAPRIHGAGPLRHRQELLHQRSHARHVGLRGAAQGDEDEPQGHHGAADVRPPGRVHERLDRRDLLHAVAPHAQGQEGRAHLAGAGRPRGRHLDREPELSAGRQQDADAGQRRPHPHAPHVQDRVRAAQHRQRQPRHRVPQRDGVHESVRPGLAPHPGRLAAEPPAAGVLGPAGAVPRLLPGAVRARHHGAPRQDVAAAVHVRVADAVPAAGTHPRQGRWGAEPARHSGSPLRLRRDVEHRRSARAGRPREDGAVHAGQALPGPPGLPGGVGRHYLRVHGGLGGGVAPLERPSGGVRVPLGLRPHLRLHPRPQRGQRPHGLPHPDRVPAGARRAADRGAGHGQDGRHQGLPQQVRRRAAPPEVLQLLLRLHPRHVPADHRELHRQEGRDHVRTAGRQEDDDLHRRHQHAGHQRVGRPDHERDHAPDDGNARVLLAGQAGRLHPHRGHPVPGGHEPPGGRQERHPAAPQAAVRHLQLHPPLQRLHRQGLRRHRPRLLLSAAGLLAGGDPAGAAVGGLHAAAVAGHQGEDAAHARQVPLRLQPARPVPHLGGRAQGAGGGLPLRARPAGPLEARERARDRGQVHQRGGQGLVRQVPAADCAGAAGRAAGRSDPGGALLRGLPQRRTRGNGGGRGRGGPGAPQDLRTDPHLVGASGQLMFLVCVLLFTSVVCCCCCCCCCCLLGCLLGCLCRRRSWRSSCCSTTRRCAARGWTWSSSRTPWCTSSRSPASSARTAGTPSWWGSAGPGSRV